MHQALRLFQSVLFLIIATHQALPSTPFTHVVAVVSIPMHLALTWTIIWMFLLSWPFNTIIKSIPDAKFKGNALGIAIHFLSLFSFQCTKHRSIPEKYHLTLGPLLQLNIARCSVQVIFKYNPPRVLILVKLAKIMFATHQALPSTPSANCNAPGIAAY